MEFLLTFIGTVAAIMASFFSWLGYIIGQTRRGARQTLHWRKRVVRNVRQLFRNLENISGAIFRTNKID